MLMNYFHRCNILHQIYTYFVHRFINTSAEKIKKRKNKKKINAYFYGIGSLNRQFIQYNLNNILKHNIINNYYNNC